jgi:serine/threonine protein kinase
VRLASDRAPGPVGLLFAMAVRGADMLERMGAARVSQAHPQIVGRYALYEKIASGGMASVHIGRLIGPVGFARTVAIKRMHPQFAEDPEFVSMFLDEARLAARIRHPNVVPTLDVVTLDGELFLVMDYVQGESLVRLIRIAVSQGKRTMPAMAATMMVGVLHGLHAAHEAKNDRGEALGIVHRDVSPHNILVGTDGIARVLDFGVAKAAGRMQTTREGQLKGKLAYMAPEQVRGGEVTRATDIYSASVVLWETLTGKRLFSGDNEAHVITNVLAGCKVPPSRLVAGLPPELDAVTMCGLNLEPHLRFATAREAARALENAMPAVAASVIGEWVEAMAKATLDERSARIAAIETDSSLYVLPNLPPARPGVRAEPTTPLVAAGDEGLTQLSSGSVSTPAGPSPGGRRRRWAVAILASGAALALVVVGLQVTTTLRGDAPAATATASAAAQPAPMVPSSVSAPTSQPVESASASPPTASQTAATVSPVKTRRDVNLPVHPRPAPSGDPCDPPYYFNSEGVRIFRPECLR